MNENLVTTTIEEKSEPRPGIGDASGLYLLTLLLVAVGGSLIQIVSVPWGLVATEILLIFLPAWAYLRLKKLPVAETVRWRWPGWRVALLTVGIGVSLFQFVSWLAILLMKVMNYPEALYAGLSPKDVFNAVVMFVGMAILAPLCEEFLFRGVIQRGYEQRGVGFAIGLVAVMFAFYHLSFLRFIGILPFALVICWMFWRSDSLVVSVLLHFSYNLFAPVSMLLALIWPELPFDWVGSLPVALGGLAAGLVLLVVFWRITPRPAKPSAPAAPFGLRQAWPLIPAGLAILFMAGIELYVAQHPELLTAAQGKPPLAFSAPEDWAQPAAWRYEIRNPAGEVIGQADCQRTAAGDEYRLECLFDHQKAYQLQMENGYFQDGIHRETVQAAWGAADLRLISWQSDLQGDGFQTLAHTVGGDQDFSLAVSAGPTPEAPLAITPATLLPGEWPWRLAALTFENGKTYTLTLAYPLRWSETAQRSLPQTEELTLRVMGKESVETPAGTLEAWKVTLGSETAWYSVESPHTLVKYDSGMTVYVLAEK